ncbi:unnamed protein product [Cunninghamella blakesleeana]
MITALRSSFPILKQQYRNIKPIGIRTIATLPKYQQNVAVQVDNKNENLVLIDEIGGSRHFTLNRPSKLNAMNIEMVKSFFPYIQAWEKSEDVNLIFLKGSDYGNRKILSSGGDVRAAVDFIKNQDPIMIDILDYEFKMFQYISTLKTPYISIMDGMTIGAGAGLSINTPFRIATEHTLFAMPESAIGLFPDVGAGFYFPRLDGELGTYLACTGHMIKSHDVLYAGLASHFIPSSKLKELESVLIEMNTNDHEKINDAINQFATQHINDEHYKNQHFTLCGEHREIIDRCFKYNSAEEIVDALEKDGSIFAKQARDTILTRSPTSVKIVLKNVRQGAKKGVADMLALEYYLWQKCIAAHDFPEGVTSHLVLKKQPEWKPKTLGEVNDQQLQKEYYDTPPKHPIQFLNDINYHENPHQHFSLPTEKEIQSIIQQHPSWSLNQLVDYYLEKRKNKFGVQEKVTDVWNRYEKNHN